MWSDAEDFKGIFIVRQALLDLPTTPERRKILADMETARFHATYLACMMSDADGFKAIDDRFGHDAGDGMLRQLARCLSQTVRTDDRVFRLGGDEFLIICAATPLEGALQTADRGVYGAKRNGRNCVATA